MSPRKSSPSFFFSLTSAERGLFPFFRSLSKMGEEFSFLLLRREQERERENGHEERLPSPPPRNKRESKGPFPPLLFSPPFSFLWGAGGSENRFFSPPPLPFLLQTVRSAKKGFLSFASGQPLQGKAQCSFFFFSLVRSRRPAAHHRNGVCLPSLPPFLFRGAHAEVRTRGLPVLLFPSCFFPSRRYPPSSKRVVGNSPPFSLPPLFSFFLFWYTSRRWTGPTLSPPPSPFFPPFFAGCDGAQKVLPIFSSVLGQPWKELERKTKGRPFSSFSFLFCKGKSLFFTSPFLFLFPLSFISKQARKPWCLVR